MDSLRIGNTNNFPLNNVDGNFVNTYGTSVTSFNSSATPKGPHTIIGGRKNKKISRYNKMSRKHTRRQRKYRRTRNRRARRSRRYHMKGGIANYPESHTQFNNNNGSLSNTYSIGGPLSASNSAMANPPIFNRVGGEPDNLNHNALNSYGNSGAGAGFPSRGWF